ncbi:MAG: SMP-30/gluconolactonase/LRE family protein [Planctomycetota bacterium]|nr:SMP-30/gluconolactonase/LRE family protein [Planctomycetota bacterium]
MTRLQAPLLGAKSRCTPSLVGRVAAPLALACLGFFSAALQAQTGVHRIGTPQNDVLKGRGGDDLLEGLGGDDVLKGRRGDDVLDGGPGADLLRGDRGDDLLRTDGSGDSLIGGRGDDTFYVSAGSDGTVVIRDFDPDDDRVVIAMVGLAGLNSQNLVQTGRHTTLTLTTATNSLEVCFRGVRRADLQEANIEFVSQTPGFGNLRLISLYDDPLAHEGPTALDDGDELVFVSNRINPNGNQFVVVSQFEADEGDTVDITDSGETIDLGLRDAIVMANGATLSNSGNIIFCRQGNMAVPAGLSLFDPETGQVTDILSEHDGKQFNSPNDVVESSLGKIWFTDPEYGFQQGFRPLPESGNNVWLFDPATGATTAVVQSPATGLPLDPLPGLAPLSRPNGIALSNDEQFLYVTDTGFQIGNGDILANGPRSVYRYRINRVNGETFLSDRETIATATNNIPDGVKVDPAGNVWYATGDGLHTIDPDNTPIGLARVPGGAANFELIDTGIYVMGEGALYFLPRLEQE